MNYYVTGSKKPTNKKTPDTVEENPYLDVKTGADILKASSNNNYTQPTENSNHTVPQTPAKSGNVYAGAYDKILKMNNESYKAYNNLINNQTATGTARLERQKKTVDDSYDDAYVQLNKEKEANLRKLPEQLAKLGLYGSGSGETAVTNITADYSNQMKSLLKAKNDAIFDIDGKIEALKQEGANKIAEYYTGLMQKQPDLLLSMLDREFSQMQFDHNAEADSDARAYRDMVFDYNVKNDADAREFNEKQYADSKETADYNKKLKEAELAAEYGNFDKLVELGVMSPEDAEIRPGSAGICQW